MRPCSVESRACVRGSGLCGLRPGRVRLGMTLEPLFGSISGRCLLEYTIGTQEGLGLGCRVEGSGFGFRVEGEP